MEMETKTNKSGELQMERGERKTGAEKYDMQVGQRVRGR
jgi:hypothetical protein